MNVPDSERALIAETHITSCGKCGKMLICNCIRTRPNALKEPHACDGCMSDIIIQNTRRMELGLPLLKFDALGKIG